MFVINTSCHHTNFVVSSERNYHESTKSWVAYAQSVTCSLRNDSHLKCQRFCERAPLSERRSLAFPRAGSPSPADEDKTTAQPDNSNEAQMTSWVLLALMAILVVAGAVVLYMAYQFYCKGRPDRASISSATRTQ